MHCIALRWQSALSASAQRECSAVQACARAYVHGFHAHAPGSVVCRIASGAGFPVSIIACHVAYGVRHATWACAMIARDRHSCRLHTAAWANGARGRCGRHWHVLQGHKNVVYAIAFNNPYGDKIITGEPRRFGADHSARGGPSPGADVGAHPAAH
jgi:hypothetical protein